MILENNIFIIKELKNRVR